MNGRQQTGPHSTPPKGTAHLNDLELRTRALERHSQLSAGSLAVIKWFAGLTLLAAIGAALGVWRTVVVSENRIENLEAQGVIDRQNIAAHETALRVLPTIALRLDHLGDENERLAARLTKHAALRRHVVEQ